MKAPPTEPPDSAPKSLNAFDFKTLDGKRAQSGDTQRRPMILSFFFAECVPCIEEVPILNAFARKHPEYRYAAFTFDDASTAIRFVQRYQLEWPVVADSRPFIDLVGVRAFPTLY